MRNFFSVICCCLFLTGCSGYRPLYGTAPNGQEVTVSLSAISVPEQRTRTGQLLRNEILSGFGTPIASQYELRMTIAEFTGAVSATPGTVVTRKRFNLTVRYELLELSSGKSLTSGSSFANVSYDTVREPIADLQSAENARLRSTTEVGQDIRQRVAAFMATRKN